jgi:hypothetical protein
LYKRLSLYLYIINKQEMNGQFDKAPAPMRKVHVLKLPEPPNTVEDEEMCSQEYIKFIDKSLQEFFDKYPYRDVNLNVIQ